MAPVYQSCFQKKPVCVWDFPFDLLILIKQPNYEYM